MIVFYGKHFVFPVLFERDVTLLGSNNLHGPILGASPLDLHEKVERAIKIS